MSISSDFKPPSIRDKSPSPRSIQSPIRARSPSLRSPSIKSPSVKSPSVKSPSVKSPTLKSPLVKSPSTESPARPQTKSPMLQSLSIKSPSIKSPQVRSPSIQLSEKTSPVRSPIKSTDNIKLESKQVNVPLLIDLDITRMAQNNYPELEHAEPQNRASVSPKKSSLRSSQIISELQPKGENLSDHVDELADTMKKLYQTINENRSQGNNSNIEKIANMSKTLTDEANALRQSIKHLSEDIVKTKQDLYPDENLIDFPYHLFLLEIIINKIHMKCECFEIDNNNLVISAKFLGKTPIILYDDQSGRKIENFSKLNIGKSTLFAMTYDKICTIDKFEIYVEITKQPPCSHCVTKIGDTRMDYTKDFISLRDSLCKKWLKDQPKDDINCTTSTPLLKDQFYLFCDGSDTEVIGMIEATVRMSFLGKDITTAFSTTTKMEGASMLLKEDNGITVYSCQKVEMDEQGKILIDEEILGQKQKFNESNSARSKVTQNKELVQQRFSESGKGYYRADSRKYDEIFTKMNDNELKIRVPKSTKYDRTAEFDRIQELCDCDSNSYNAGEQIQFEMPRDLCNTDKSHNTYTSHLKYSYNGCDRSCEQEEARRNNRKVINVTPTNCTVPVQMEKVLDPYKDVFVLKIGKKLETKDKKTDLEIELITPKAPSAKAIENNISQQCSLSDVKNKKQKEDKKGKGGKKKKSGKKKEVKKGKK